MVQADHPAHVKELMARALPLGAEAFGMQFCRLQKEFRTRKVYRDLIAHAGDLPTYVTNYRHGSNQGESDESIADGLLEIASCGATVCDVMGDLFDRQPDEMARDPHAIEKQMRLIDEIHKQGSFVLMSSHIFKFTPAERILEIALEQQRRGADICKIVAGASTMQEQLENLRIVDMLKEKLDIPFLFLSSGECKILRRIGGEIGCCMYLCVVEHDALSTTVQPLLDDMRTIRALFEK